MKIKGEYINVAKLARENNLSIDMVRQRIKAGYSLTKSLEKRINVTQLAKQNSIDRGLVYNRVTELYWPLEKALNTPVRHKKKAVLSAL